MTDWKEEICRRIDKRDLQDWQKTNCFRIIVFLQNCGPQQYDWFMEDDKKLMIEHGRAYYVNTRMTHRTISWVDKSDHMIMNIPMTTENVERVIANLLHTH